MASNPRIPSDQATVGNNKRPQLVPGPPPKRPGSGVPGVLFAIVVAAALIAAIVYYMPRAPKKAPAPTAAQVPAQPVPNQLQFSAMRMVLAPGGGAMTLQGQVTNTGNRSVISSVAELTFQNASGAILSNLTAPMIGMSDKNGALVRDDFTKNPLKPNDTRAFTMTVSQVPAGWNHALPQLRVLTVSAKGSR